MRKNVLDRVELPDLSRLLEKNSASRNLERLAEQLDVVAILTGDVAAESLPLGDPELAVKNQPIGQVERHQREEHRRRAGDDQAGIEVLLPSRGQTMHGIPRSSRSDHEP